MKQLHLFISGSVQGVGYRQFVKNWAKKKNINGWVRNLPDGHVEVVVQGEDQQLNELLGLLHKGPSLAQVKDIKVQEEEPDQFETFDIK